MGGTIAFQIGGGDNWPILVIGVVLDLAAKATVTTSTGRPYEWSNFRNDLLMAGFLVAVAAFEVERLIEHPIIPVTTYGELILWLGWQSLVSAAAPAPRGGRGQRERVITVAKWNDLRQGQWRGGAPRNALRGMAYDSTSLLPVRPSQALAFEDSR